HYRWPRLRVQFDDLAAREEPTLALTLALGRREGNFVLAPDARLDDGLFDYVHVGRLSRLGLIAQGPGMISGRLPDNHPHIGRGRCLRAHIRSETPLVVHTDGEFFCRPEDGVQELEATLLPGRLRVIGRIGETPLADPSPGREGGRG